MGQSRPEDGAHEGRAGERLTPRVGGTDAPKVRVRDAGSRHCSSEGAGRRFQTGEQSARGGDLETRAGRGPDRREKQLPYQRHRRTLWRSLHPSAPASLGLQTGQVWLHSVKTGFILGD